MIEFWLAASAMIAIALGFILPPLLRNRPTQSTAMPDEPALAVYRDRLAEIESERENGDLTPAEHAEARAELERSALAALGAASPASTSTTQGSALGTAIAVALLLPAFAFGLYLRIGAPQATSMQAPPVQASPDRTRSQIASMVGRLEEHMRAHPEDVTGWKMLARSYIVMQRAEEALKAYKEAVDREPRDAEALAGYAELLAQARQGDLSGEIGEIIDRALQVAPNEPKVLWLAGAAAYQGGRFQQAIEHLEKLRSIADLGDQQERFVTDILERARRASGAASVDSGAQAAAGAPAGITVEVKLDDRLKPRLAGSETVFIFARAASGPPMPLAVVRRNASELPLKVTLDDSQAMAPGMTLSRFPRIVIGARISKSGSATPAPGDIEGSTGELPAAQAGTISLTIDREVE
ncbi:MAG: c-type cytochrome biogenesis protein CcmI [Gammaproteobacteria bacterium]